MRRSIVSVACLILSFALPVVAAQDADAAGDRGLLDPSLPAERRRELADALLRSALAGDATSQELAGTLYLLGRSRPGNLLPRDIPRARRLLTAAANRGRRHAMHRLAELELGDGHGYEAALWARVEQELYGASSDTPLDAEVAYKVQTIREAIATDARPAP